MQALFNKLSIDINKITNRYSIRQSQYIGYLLVIYLINFIYLLNILATSKV